MTSREIAHVTTGRGRWVARAYREGRAYEGRGPTREAAETACDQSLALDGWPRGPGPRRTPTTTSGPQGPQLELT